MDKTILKEALETINDAILELNDEDASREDFYWWNAVLNIFEYRVDKNGAIQPLKGG